MIPILLTLALAIAPFPAEPAPGLPAPIHRSQELDSIKGEMARGRYWHAARALWAAYPEGPGAVDSLVLLFAEAEGGWNNWREVRQLLEGPLEAGDLENSHGWYLLGRGLEEEGIWEEAEEAYSRLLERLESDDENNRTSALSLEILARRARVRIAQERFLEAVDDTRALGVRAPALGGWLALEGAKRAAEAGAREATRALFSSVALPEMRDEGLLLPARALLAAGDSAGAEAAFWSLLPLLASASEQASAWERVGTLRLARGDSLGGKAAFHQVLHLLSSGAASVRAAEGLLTLGFDSVGVALAAARALAGDGQGRSALEAYGVHEILLGSPMMPGILLERARVHFDLGEINTALGFATQLGELGIPDVSAPAMALRARALRRLGRGGEARRVEDIMVERFPQRTESVEVLYTRADGLRSRGDLEGAIHGFAAIAASGSALSRAGEARMNMARILLSLGREEEALEVYSDYLEAFPDGRRWDEAAFWGGHTLISLAREPEATELFREMKRRFPLSYYTLQAGAMLGEVFDPGIPVAADSLPFPSFLKNGLVELDLLAAAGLDEGAAWQTAQLAEAVRRAPDPDVRHQGLLRLALELNARGFTREGINLGWELRRGGVPWDTGLLSAIYPFPYRALVEAEAGERGVDPFLMAGLIRQESAFWMKARSRADARGLMQVLPSTGRDLARASGPAGFDADSHLYVAEINIHLGMAFHAEMSRRFEDVHIVLCAYNAGPSRAQRWRQFPEAADIPRFVERIPFTETKGYVKAVLLNRAVYSWLYGGAES